MKQKVIPFAPREIAVLYWIARQIPVSPDPEVEVTVDEVAMSQDQNKSLKGLRQILLLFERYGIITHRPTLPRGYIKGAPRTVTVATDHPVWDWLRAYGHLAQAAQALGPRPEAPAKVEEVR